MLIFSMHGTFAKVVLSTEYHVFRIMSMCNQKELPEVSYIFMLDFHGAFHKKR